MAKKRRKVYRKTKTGWKELSPYLQRKAERARQQRAKPKVKKRESEAAKLAGMRMLIREAAKSGAAEAIEHCQNFWNVSDGYKKYIEQQIELQSQALLTVVKTALRDELALYPWLTRKRRR
jgi:hypothetical protein